MISVLSVASRALVDACERLGLDTDAMLTAAGLSREEVLDPDARLPADKTDALWRQAYAAAGDPQLSLHAAAALPFGAYKVLDFICANAPTVGEALLRIARYFPLVDTRGRLTIVEGDPVRFEMAAATGPVPPPAQEYTFAAVVLRSRAGTGVDWPLEAVELSFPAPPSVDEYERIFGCPVRFDQPSPALLIPASSWALRIEGANAALFSVLDDHARRLLDELPPDEDSALIRQLRGALAEELRGGDTSVAHVAKRLGLGERTLQRRLKETGLHYADVLANVRAELARGYLRESGVSLAEVAWLLGFSEQSAFSRAFKRWTGQTPGAWRSAHAAP